MSRSAWKFLPLTNDDMINYLSKTIFNKILITPYTHRRLKTLNMWTTNQFYKVNQGKYTVVVRTSPYSCGTKLGMYAHTRKPFFFREKKKKR